MKKTQIAVAVFALGSCSGAWADSAGRVLAVAGDANIERAGAKLAIGLGTLVETGDVLVVGDKSTLQVRFSDESIVALRANSQFKIQDYQYDRKAESDRSVMSLIRGGLRTITGLIGKANRKAFALNTPTATIGIRGTHFTVVSCDNDCTHADGSPAPNGTFGGVTDGRIGVANLGGETEFGQQDYFFVADQNTAPVRLLAPPPVLNDRGLVARGRGATLAPAAAGASVGTSSASGTTQALATSRDSASPLTSTSTQTSTSPQAATSSPLVMQGSPSAAFQASDTITVPAGNGRIVLATHWPTGPNVREGTPDLGGFWDPAINLTGVTDASKLAASIDAAATDPLRQQVFTPTTFNAAANAYWLYDTLRVAHYIFADSPVVALPTSGIAQYNYAGGSPATDNFLRKGTFAPGNLSINFATQSVTNISNMAMNFDATAALPATSYTVPAGASWKLAPGGQALPVNCTAGCQTLNVSTATTAGQLAGANGQSYIGVIKIQSTVLSSGTGHVAGASAAFIKAK